MVLLMMPLDKLFSFSLKNKAKSWLNSLPVRLLITWDVLALRFLAKYFSLAKTIKMKNDITNFFVDGDGINI